MATRYWGGGGNTIVTGIWSDPENWSGGVVPQAGDDVIFDGSEIGDCTLDVSTAALNSLDIQSGYTGTFDANGFNVDITGGGDLILSSGIVNMGSGTWRCSGDFDFFNTADLTINEGTSLVVMTGNGKEISGSWANRLYDLQISNDVSVGASTADRVTCANDFTVDVGKTFTVTNGDLRVSHDINVNGTITGALELHASGGTLTVALGGSVTIADLICRNLDIAPTGTLNPTTGSCYQNIDLYTGTYGGTWTFDQETNTGNRTVTFHGACRFTGDVTFDQDVNAFTYTIDNSGNYDMNFDSDCTFAHSGTSTLSLIMGDGTWTCSGSWDSHLVDTMNYGNSELVMSGVGETIRTSTSLTKSPYDITIQAGASISIDTEMYSNNDVTIDGTLDVDGGIGSCSGDLAISGILTDGGAGLFYVKGGSITDASGTISCDSLYVRAGAAITIAPGTYGCNTFRLLAAALGHQITPDSGTYIVTGTMEFNSPNATSFSLVNSTNSPNWIFRGNVTINETGSGAFTWTKGGGIVTLATASPLSIDFGGASIEDLVITATSGNVTLVSGFTTTSLQVQVVSPYEIYWGGNTFTINGLFSGSGNGSWNSASLGGTTFNVNGNFLINDTTIIGDTPWWLNITGVGKGFNVDVMNSDASGGETVKALTCVDLGNNYNWFFGNPVTPEADTKMNTSYEQRGGMFILQCSDIPLDSDAWDDIIWVDGNAIETFGDDPSLLFCYQDATKEKYRVYAVKMDGFVRENDKMDLTRVLRNYPLNTSILSVYKLEISDKHMIAYCYDTRNTDLKSIAVVLENAAYNIPLEFRNNDINMSYDTDIRQETRNNQPWYRIWDEDGEEIEDEEVQAMKDTLAIYAPINSYHDSLHALIDAGFTGQKFLSENAPETWPVFFPNLGDDGTTKQAKEQCPLKIQDQLFLRRDGDPDDVNCDCEDQRRILYVYDFEPMTLFYDLDTMTPDPNVYGYPTKVALHKMGMRNDEFSGFEDVCRFSSDWFTYNYDRGETFPIVVRQKIRLNLYSKFQQFVPYCANGFLRFNWGMHFYIEYLDDDPTTTIPYDWIVALDEEIYMPVQLYNECNPVGIYYTTNVVDDGSTLGCEFGLQDPWDIYDIIAAKVSLV